MARFEVIMQASIYIRLSFLFLCLTALIHVIGLSSPYWYDHDGIHGIWPRCSNGACDSLSRDAAWMQAIRFLEMSSFLLLGCIMGCIIVYRIKSHRVCLLVATTATAISGIFILIGAIIYAAEIPNSKYLSWAFGFEIVAAIMCLIAVAPLVLEVRSSRSNY